eukprot:CAMPEP_0114567608 /NCGR_PEP_ID=MMETSP0114-20121206/15575_1 /TAXON_ID=31324 /ORGANISM="Goniomonas sp, Strain m" /LENGTH=364 /DNA_ID=CAMNT_0001754215 /DNA_START=9 /DNA_END=1103 /DNA_ORIENTATION=-
MCSACGHSMIFHDDDDVAKITVNSPKERMRRGQKEVEKELAPVKRKSVVQQMIGVFGNMKTEEDLPGKIEAPRRKVSGDPDEGGRSAKDAEEAAAKAAAEKAAAAKAAADKAAADKAAADKAAADKAAADKAAAEKAAREAYEQSDAGKREALIAKHGACAQCGDPLTVFGSHNGVTTLLDGGKVKVHEACGDAWIIKNVGACAHCKKALIGSFMIYPGKTDEKVHDSCKDAYLINRYGACKHCGLAIFKTEGKFSGDECTVGDAKLHIECGDAYIASIKPPTDPCKQCGLAIEKTAKFSGTAMKYGNGDKVHLECKDDYILATSEKCKHCSGPLAIIEGKFDGTYYIVGDAKVHTECWDAFPH